MDGTRFVLNEFGGLALPDELSNRAMEEWELTKIAVDVSPTSGQSYANVRRAQPGVFYCMCYACVAWAALGGHPSMQAHSERGSYGKDFSLPTT